MLSRARGVSAEEWSLAREEPTKWKACRFVASTAIPEAVDTNEVSNVTRRKGSGLQSRMAICYLVE